MRGVDDQAPTYRMNGSINPRGDTPAICVPTFGRRGDNRGMYTQCIGLDHSVLSFEILEEDSHADLETGKVFRNSLSVGSPAVYHIMFDRENKADPLLGPHSEVRPSLLKNRWRVDAMSNPFERLDFAQLANYSDWFSYEAGLCEGAFKDRKTLIYWLEVTLLLSRASYALDVIAMGRGVPRPLRRRISAKVRVKADEPVPHIANRPDLQSISPKLRSKDFDTAEEYLSGDVAAVYALRRLNELRGYEMKEPSPPSLPLGQPGSTGPRGPSSERVAARWTKKLSASDAQRKPSGNERGSITLVKAGHPIDWRTYFRKEFFADVEWVLGWTRTRKRREAATVRFETTVLGTKLGELSIPVTYEPHRESGQDNYTSLLHLGPLAPYFERHDMTGRQLTMERRADGSFALSIQ